MMIRYIVGIVFFAAAVVCAMAANLQYMEMQCELNKRLPEGQKFEPLFWHIGMHMKFRKLRKEFLPESRRPRLIRRLCLAGLVCFVVATVLVAPKLWPN